MALINCPECNGRASTQAKTCPHCGYPINSDVATLDQHKHLQTLEVLEPEYTNRVLATIQAPTNADAKYFYNLLSKKKIVVFDDFYGEPDLYYCKEDGTIWVTDATTCPYARLRKINSSTASATIEDVFKKAEETTMSTPKCPTCGSTNVVKHGIGSRMIDGFVFGHLSVEGRAQWMCKSCGHMW